MINLFSWFGGLEKIVHKLWILAKAACRSVSGIPLRDAYGREEHAPHKISTLWHRTSEVRPPLGPPVRGEHISRENLVIKVHIHSKDAYGREEHATHKIRALWHRTSELRPPLGPPVRGEHISLESHVIRVHIHSEDAYGREEHARIKLELYDTALLSYGRH